MSTPPSGKRPKVLVVRFPKRPGPKARKPTEPTNPTQPAASITTTTTEIDLKAPSARAPSQKSQAGRRKVGQAKGADLPKLYVLGHQLFESGQLQEALKLFEPIVQRGVKDAFPHTMLGTIYLASGKTTEAAALFDAALSLDPQDVAAMVYRAEIRLTTGNGKAQAREELKRAIKLGASDDPFVQRAQRLLRS